MRTFSQKVPYVIARKNVSSRTIAILTKLEPIVPLSAEEVEDDEDEDEGDGDTVDGELGAEAGS